MYAPIVKKILLVDDDRLNITLIRFAFKEKLYQVVTAQDGQEGLEVFRRERPDCIILDIQMPQMSGFEFISELETIPGGKDVPVIMLTANDSMQDVFLTGGVKGYFVKPVDPPVLLEKVRVLLDLPPTHCA